MRRASLACRWPSTPATPRRFGSRPTRKTNASKSCAPIPMGMPWESLHVEVRLVGAEVVKQQEGIVELGAAPTNRAMKVDASAFDGRAALDNHANQQIG